MSALARTGVGAALAGVATKPRARLPSRVKERANAAGRRLRWRGWGRTGSSFSQRGTPKRPRGGGTLWGERGQASGATSLRLRRGGAYPERTLSNSQVILNLWPASATTSPIVVYSALAATFIGRHQGSLFRIPADCRGQTGREVGVAGPPTQLVARSGCIDRVAPVVTGGSYGPPSPRRSQSRAGLTGCALGLALLDDLSSHVASAASALSSASPLYSERTQPRGGLYVQRCNSDRGGT